MLAALADTDDLTARNIAVPDGVDAATILDAASAAIREAAGCSISYGPSTITLVVDDPCDFDLPAGPVASVASVVVDSVAVSGWRKVGDTLHMPRTRWWGVNGLPVEVTVTYTHGYPVVPADIVDLACSLAAMAFAAAAAGGYGSDSRTDSIKLGDYAESFNHPTGTESPSPVAIPDTVRDALRARFGTSVGLLKMR